MSTRTIMLPEDPLRVALIVETDTAPALAQVGELVLGTFERHDIAHDIALWVGDGSLDGQVFNRAAHTLWTQRFGPKTELLMGTAVLTGGLADDGTVRGLTDDQILAVERDLGMVRVLMENTYEDGHESQAQFLLPLPSDVDDSEEIDDWWEDVVFLVAGDGHGEKHPKLGSLHEATVLSGPAQLVGETREWG